jgi:mRNA interferase RelE/StbE
MTLYSIIFKPSVEKDLRRLQTKTADRILLQIEKLETDPFSRQSLRLSGTEQLYRLRVGDYRVIYEVDTLSRQVIIHYVRHRREVYREL